MLPVGAGMLPLAGGTRQSGYGRRQAVLSLGTMVWGGAAKGRYSFQKGDSYVVAQQSRAVVWEAPTIEGSGSGWR